MIADDYRDIMDRVREIREARADGTYCPPHPELWIDKLLVDVLDAEEQ